MRIMKTKINLPLNFDEANVLLNLLLVAYERDMGTEEANEIFNILIKRLILLMNKNKWH